MNPFEVREIVGRLAAAYPDPPMSDETRKLYERFLSDLPYEQTDVAVDDLNCDHDADADRESSSAGVD